jgi:ParB family chromosome partitioning protein
MVVDTEQAAEAEAALEVSRETLKGKPGKYPCPTCSYSAMTAGSLKGHVGMAHPVVAAEAFIPPDVASANVAAFQAKVAELAPARTHSDPPTAMSIPIAKVEVATNVREDLGDLEELAASIREHGVIQPITVTGVYHDGQATGFRVLDGHRRLAASAIAGLERIPAIFDHRLELGDDNARRRTTQLVANVQRKDLNPIELATNLRAIIDARKDLTHAEVAKWIGKDRTWVTNALRLLETAPEVQAAVAAGTISATHARSIAGVELDLQPRLLESVVDRGISAHETERQAEYFKTQARAIRDRAEKIDATAAGITKDLEKVTTPAKAQIGLADYAGTAMDLRGALERTGWNVADGYGWTTVKNAGECGCDGVWRVEVAYSGAVKVAPACNSNKHAEERKAKVDANWQRDQAKAQEERRLEREKIEAASIRVRDAIGEILAERPPSELARRLLVWGLIVADEEPDEQLVAKYLGGETEGQEDVLYEVDDAAWLLTEAIPAADLEDVQGRLVSRLFGSYMAGPGVKAAVETWSAEAHPETLELEAEKKGKGRKRLAGELRLGDPVVIGGDEFVVVSIVSPGVEPGQTERPPSIVQLAVPGPVKAVDYRLHRVMLPDLTADTKERVWRASAGALVVTKQAAEDAVTIAAAREPGGVLECVGSNHVPGCAHQGGEIPPARPSPAAER